MHRSSILQESIQRERIKMSCHLTDAAPSNSSWREFKRTVAEGTVPCALRATDNQTNTCHFVEWHSGNAQELRKQKSHSQVCIYKDLCEVRTVLRTNGMPVMTETQRGKRGDADLVQLSMWSSAVAVLWGLSWTSDGESVVSVMTESALDSGTTESALSLSAVKNVSLGQSLLCTT